MSEYGTHTMDYIKVHLMVSAMESLLTVEQGKRILKAAEMGGFDAGMVSLARVSEQIAKAASQARIDAARLEGRIMGLQSQLESEKGRADRAMAALNTIVDSPSHMSVRTHSFMAMETAKNALANAKSEE
jgi:hypothetical protein